MNNINLTKDELDKLVKSEGLEVYPQDQFAAYIEGNKELLIKGETSDLDDIEKSEYNTLQEEIKSFKRIEVYNLAENSQNRIEKSIVFVRPKQVEWSEEIQKSESGEEEKVKKGIYTDTVLNRNLNRVGKTYGEIEKSEEEDLEKAKTAIIGEVHTWNGKKFKKQPNGKWLEVSESHEMTKKEHSDKGLHSGDESWAHTLRANKLSDKEYSDEEVGLGRKSKK